MNELQSYGTTVVYAVRRWPKRRYAAHDCTWKITSLLDESELTMITLMLVASGRRKGELQVLCKASFGTEIYATLQSRRRINLCRYKKKVQQYYVRSAWCRTVGRLENNELQMV